ncbi:MAG: hypothetical protein CYPHOPRED_006063 [Cyphobasidiales sp. Tagirdzhanova-0007]|nr:MAG: hypothetical protein CYPHOPRED_006063 [Cyphobasidiales sp. Tagirdzhanova-0007]
MQIFVRGLEGASRSFTATSPSDLLSQLDLSPFSSHQHLSYRSRTLAISSTSAHLSFDDLRIPPYATLDLSISLPGGGPKKRCAHVFVKSGNATVSSGSNAPQPTATQEEASMKKNEGKSAAAAIEGTSNVDKTEASIAPPATLALPSAAATEPSVERCVSAALRMIGECPRCEKAYCGAHRLPEDHACPALANFRKAAFDENRAKLEKEATHNSKISAF